MAVVPAWFDASAPRAPSARSGQGRNDAGIRRGRRQGGGQRLPLLFECRQGGAEGGRLLEAERRHRKVVAVAQPGQFALDLDKPGAPRGDLRRLAHAASVIFPA